MNRLPARDGRRFVRDDGPLDARIVAIGEAPGRFENSSGRPFVGPAGTLLARWLKRAGLQRRDLYITNTFAWQPPYNKLELIPGAERERWINGPDGLHDRLAKLEGPVVIVPMGNYALQALTGKTGISKHRGSIYCYTDRRGREIKVIPALHPASVFRAQNTERRCILDWKRIADDATFAELRLPRRTHEIMPTLRDVELFRDDKKRMVARGEKFKLVCDIETPIKWLRKLIGHSKKGKPKYKRTRGARFVAVVGFADSAEHSLTIPTTRSFWGDKATVERVWEVIAEILALDCEKGFQNGWFDTWHLEGLGLPVRRWVHDSMAYHHCLIPNEDHDLAFMASVDTRQPYWKDDAKSQDKGIPVDLETYWNYNGVDCCTTYELIDVYRARLEQQGRLDVYMKHYPKLFRPVLNMSLEGMRTDEARRRKRYAHLTADLIECSDRLEALAGQPLFGAKGSISTKKLRVFLHDKLDLPTIEKRNTKGDFATTTNEIAVRKLQLRYGPRRPEVQEACQLILDHRRKDKLRTFYVEKVADADGRVRCSFTVAPETGRLSSRRNPSGTGLNLQNVDREARDYFVPDEGHVFVRCDLSQAESRWVYMLTGDPELIELARTPPWDFDVHTANAAMIFGVSEKNVTKMQRYQGKRAIHAGHYGMAGKKLSEVLMQEGFVLSPIECDALIERYMVARPAIKDEFQLGIRRQIITQRYLENSWKHRIDFSDVRLGPEIFREGYAFIPQSEVSFTLNRYGLIPLHKFLRGMESKLRNQVHDELIVSCPPDEAWDVYRFLKDSLERPRPTPYGELTVPVTVKLGDRWSGGIEFDRPPKRKQFQEAVESYELR